jgi:hypothetical protein
MWRKLRRKIWNDEIWMVGTVGLIVLVIAIFFRPLWRHWMPRTRTNQNLSFLEMNGARFALAMWVYAPAAAMLCRTTRHNLVRNLLGWMVFAAPLVVLGTFGNVVLRGWFIPSWDEPDMGGLRTGIAWVIGMLLQWYGTTRVFREWHNKDMEGQFFEVDR